MPVFAIGSTVLVGSAGLAVDLGRGQLARADLQRAVDAAALATVATMVRSGGDPSVDETLDPETVRRMNGIVRANLDASWSDVPLEVSYRLLPEEAGLRVAASAELPTTLMAVVGVTTMTIGAEASAAGGRPPMEIALVIDTSSSIGGDLPKLQKAATDFVDTLFGDEETLPETYVSVVPFTRQDKVDRTGWLAASPPPDWAGCTSERAGDPLSYLDRVPSLAGFPAWQPHIDFEDDYNEGWYGEKRNRAAGFQCPASAVLPLSNRKSTLRNYLNALSVSSGTCADIGFAWGVRSLSADWRGLWGDPLTPSSIDDRGKAIVLMTDGQSAPGCTDAKGGSNRARAILLSYCSEMKTRGYAVVTVAIDTPASVQAMLRECASNDAYYYEVVDWSDLATVTRGIATEIGGGKVRRIH